MSGRHLTTVAVALAALVAGTVDADTEGAVVSVRGDIIQVAVTGGPAPAVGDAVTVMNRRDAVGNATAIGRWRVTGVLGGGQVTAVREASYGPPPEAGMPAVISSSHRPDTEEGPDVEIPGEASSGVPGKVTEVRGDEVTIQLDREAAPAVGDRVELSYSFGEDTIGVGTWRVTAVRGDGRIDAEPVEARGQPTPRMDAVVFATGTRAAEGRPPTGAGFGRDVAGERFEEAARLEPKDPARALELYVEAAGLGHAEAAERAGLAFEYGRGTTPDDAAAVRFYRQAAEAGRPIAQTNYGAFLGAGRGGIAVDDAKAVGWFKKAAAQGESYAQANLCFRYGEGQGVEKDLDEALRLCRLAAAQDNPVALDRLGWMYQVGLGVAVDLAEAFRCYERSAKLGYADGQNNLGYLYEQGWGVTRDIEQAHFWYRQAAAQGYAWGEWNLGRVYQEGIGVPADQARAIEHFQRA
ncbi:MAG TPA: hypothetical protein PLS95_17230, partial [Thermoanaerobaculales bacterium]|nr:hypothetical protein [Thermoanaerobaculales bacterium]